MSEKISQANQLPPRSRGKSTSTKKLQYIGLGLLLILVIVIIYYIYSILSFASSIADPEDSRFKDVQTEDDLPPAWEGTDRVNILLLGGDARGMGRNEIPRTDSMIVVSIDPVTKKAHLLSILRDTYDQIPGHGRNRINAAITLGGPALAMKTVSELTGLSVQYYVYTEFQGFIALIDTLGGIEFEVEKRMYYVDSHDDPMYHIDLRPGLQHMDGQTALQYVRFRHDAMSDYSRTERQREFLSAIATKLTATSSILKLPALLNNVAPHIQTNMGFEDMIKLGRLGFEIDTGSISSIQIPPPALLREERIGGADVITIRNSAQLRQFIQDQLNAPDADAMESPSTP